MGGKLVWSYEEEEEEGGEENERNSTSFEEGVWEREGHAIPQNQRK